MFQFSLSSVFEFYCFFVTSGCHFTVYLIGISGNNDGLWFMIVLNDMINLYFLQ